jgi:anti-sigma-K factor RskA
MNDVCYSKIKKILSGRKTAQRKVSDAADSIKKNIESDRDSIKKINEILDKKVVNKVSRWNKRLSYMGKAKSKTTPSEEKIRRLASCVNEILIYQTNLEKKLDDYWEKFESTKKKTQKAIQETLEEVKDIRSLNTQTVYDDNPPLQLSLFKPATSIDIVTSKTMFQRTERKKKA